MRITYYTYCAIPKELPGKTTPATAETIENAIGNLFHRQFDDRVVSIEFRGNELALSIPIRSAKEGSKTGLQEVGDKMLELLNDYYKVSKPLKLRNHFVAMYDDIPTFKISCDRISLNFSSLAKKEISLHDIHKVVDTKHLTLFSSASVTIASSVLGLLKIPRLEKLDFMGITQKAPKWFEIVKNHFNSGKNVFACQEELIDAGLKDYAEL